MNNKGFTLIELLAVIVVLSIIALIATPIVSGVIETSKKNVAIDGASNLIKSAEVYMVTSRKKYGRVDVLDPNLNYNGKKPEAGEVEISKEGKTKLYAYIDGYCVTKEYDGEVTATKTNKKECTVICDLQEGTSKTVGSKYTCHLDQDRTFYVLETSEDNVSLIMDSNFTDDAVSTVAWCIDGGSDNTTCKNINSKEEGTPLKHIQDTFGTKVDVSFPSANQIAKASGQTFNNSTVSGLPSWLYDHSGGCYWTTSPTVDNFSRAWLVCYDSRVRSGGVIDSARYVVRPVITVSKLRVE